MTPNPEPERQAAARHPGRLRRALGAAAASLGLTGVFAGASLLGAALHLDTPAARRIARDVTNEILSPLFEGRIVADEIDELSLRGARIRAATALDPRGVQVVRASGLRARVDVLALLRDVLAGGPELRIEIPYIRVEQAEVLVEQSAAGGVTLGDAFAPKPPLTPPAPKRHAAPPRRVFVALPRIEIGRGWVHGQLSPPRSLDADVSRLSGSIHVSPEGVAVDVDETGLVDRAFLPATTAGIANYHLWAGNEVRMWSSFAGQLDDVALTARAVLAGGHLTAQASVPRATPEELRSLIPDYPLAAPISAKIELDGDLPELDVAASVVALPAGAAGGGVEIEGRLDAAGPVRLDAAVRARDVDLQLFEALRGALPGSPGPQLNAEGRLKVEVGDELRLAVDARTEPTALRSQPMGSTLGVPGRPSATAITIPAADVHLVLDRGELHGTAHLYEPGMPIDGTFTLLPRGGGIRFSATADVPSIAAAPRLVGPVDGSARVRVSGTLRGDALDARATGDFAELKVDRHLELGSARLEGRITGPLEALRVDASLSGREATVGGYTFDAFTAQAAGPITAPELRATVTDGADELRASARLQAASGALSDIGLALRREDNEIEMRIASIEPSRGGIVVEGLALRGAKSGAVDGRLVVRGDDVTGALRGEAVDVGHIARMVGLPLPVRGRVSFDVALENDRRTGRSGRVMLDLMDGEIAFVPGISAKIAATIDRDDVKADGLVQIAARSAHGATPGELRCSGAIASVRLSRGEGRIQGPLLRGGTWEGLVGSADVAAEDWDLGCLAELLPINHLVSEVRGRLSTRFRVVRASGARFPSIEDLTARTRGLVLAGPHALGEERPVWESRSVDALLKGSLDGATGKTDVALTLYDGGLLGDLSGTIDLDLPALIGPSRRRSASLLRSRIAGKISVPRRSMSSFATLPTFVRDALPPLGGEVRIDAYADGTIARPFVAVRALWWGLAYAGQSGPSAAGYVFPADVDALLTYDSKKATLDAHVTHGAREIGTVSAEVIADLDDVLAPPRPGRRGPLWTGGFRARLSEVPLGDIPLLDDGGIGGHVSGEIAASGLGVAPTYDVRLELPDLKLGDDAFFERCRLALRVEPTKDPGKGELRVTELSLVGQDGGRLSANAYAGVRFRDGVVPALDGDRASLAVSANRFGLAALQPLVSGVVSRLDGQLTGDVRVEVGQPGDGGQERIQAELRVDDGVVHIPELGQELRDVTASVVADRERSLLRLDVSAAGTSGRAEAWALLRLDGLALRDGAGQLRIARGEEIPLTLEGVPLGTASGELTFSLEKRPRELALRVAVPSLWLTLPATSTRDVQPLDEHPDIGVSHPLGPEKQRRAADALRYVLAFDLGDVSVEGSGMRLRLTSPPSAPPTVVLAEETRVSGDITITRGQFEVFGRSFEIERGLVRLREQEASNPYLNVTAHWDAPDGTRIYADYVGELRPVTNEKLRFRSDPPVSQRDILARLLFGEGATGGAMPGGGDTTATQKAGEVAASVGGELAAAQFNALLSGITPLRGLSTRIGTTSEGTLQTSLVYQVDDTLTALATFRQGQGGATGTAGATPGGTASQQGQETELSIDWRFHRNWSLRGTLGMQNNRASSGILDLLWQYRY